MPHFHILLGLLIAMLTRPGQSQAAPTPSLVYLYTAYLITGPGLYDISTPLGPRGQVAVTGGNFSGPSICGTVLAGGADNGGADPNTGILYPDVRYSYNTSEGVPIFAAVKGATRPDGCDQVTVVHQVADKRYFWLNDVVSVGTVCVVSETAAGLVFKTDVFYVGFPPFLDLSRKSTTWRRLI